jgi:sulfite reductase (ferredoxin)
MKFLFLSHGWTADSYLAEVERRLGYKLDPPVAAGQPDGSYRDHVGVHPQKDPSLCYAGFSVTMGRITPDQLRTIGDLAFEYGSGSLRLTAMQNIVVGDIPRARVNDFVNATRAAGLALGGSAFQRGTVSCTGSEFCKLAITETKRFSMALVADLESRLPGFSDDIKLHVTGCPNSCGQHWIADVGLQGVMMTHKGEQVEGYDVFVGGAAGPGAAVAHRVGFRVPASETAAALERLFVAFNRERTPGEPFRGWIARNSDQHVKKVLNHLI